MPLRRYPQPQFGIASQTSSIPSDAQERILDSIIRTAEGGVKSYHIGSRGLERYALKDLMDLWASLGASQSGLTGRAIQVRRGVPTDW